MDLSSRTFPSVVFSEINLLSAIISPLTFSSSLFSICCSFRCFCSDLFLMGLCEVNLSCSFSSNVFSEIILLSPLISSLTFSSSVSSFFCSFRCFCSDLFLMRLSEVNSYSTLPAIVFSEIILLPLTLSSLTFSSSVSSFSCSFCCFCSDLLLMEVCEVNSGSTRPSNVCF